MKQTYLQLRSTVLFLFLIFLVPIFPSANTREDSKEPIVLGQELVYIPIEADTYIYEHPVASNTNYGNSEIFILGADSDGNKYDPLLDFDIANNIPNGATILSAELRIVSTNEGGAFWGFPFSIVPISESWNEFAVTANNRPAYHQDIVVNHVLDEENQVMVFEINEIVQKWVSGEIEEHGLYLTSNVIMNTESFYAYNPPMAFSPLLVVTYIPPPKSWTLMYFLAEDNNLSSHGLFQESQLRAGVVNNNINVTVFYDGLETEAKYVGLAPNKADDVVESKGELSTGDPDVLTDFIQWSQLMYQAENYALILYDHSSGVSGFGIDKHPGDDKSDCVTGKYCLTFRELQQALANIPLLDIIYIEACSSATVEVAYELRNQANYLVASQQTAWGPSSHKSVLLSIDQTTSPIDLATSMAENYYDIFKGITDNSEEDRPGTISVVDLLEVDNVANAIDNLATLLEANMQAYQDTITTILADVQHLDSDGDFDIDTDDEFIDLYHFSLLVNERINDVAIQNSAQTLIATLNGYIIWNGAWSGSFSKPVDPCIIPGKCDWELGNSYGVSIFFPNFSRSFYQDGWLDFTAGTIWDIFPLAINSNVTFGNTISWGPMLVEYIRETNPDQLDDPNPPPLQPLLEYLSYTYSPAIFR